jgi:hypothetical protein
MSVKTGLPRISRKSRLFTAVCAGAVALSTSLSANAAFVLSGGSPPVPLPISGNDFNIDLQGEGFNEVTIGAQLSVDQDGFVTFYYIAAESWFTNSFHSGSDSMTENDDSFNFNGYDSMTIGVSAGDALPFSFQSTSGSALAPVDNASGNNLEGLGIIMTGASPVTSASTSNSLMQLVLAYNDNPEDSGDTDYDDMLVRAEFSPVPVPAAVWLFGSGLLGLIGAARRKA